MSLPNQQTSQLKDLNLDALLTHVYAHATSMKSHLHGEMHWLRVTKVGLELARFSPDCDPLVIFLFGLLHDTQRLKEGRDPQHGERAAHFAQSMNDQLLLLSDDQLRLLAFACHEHDNGTVSDDPTIGICWDADRLNLWRVHRIPRSKFLSTPMAKTWSMRFKALTVQFQSFTWHDLYLDYLTL